MQKIKKILISGSRLSFTEISNKLNEVNPETVFFILRQMCFNNELFSVEGNWSSPSSLLFKKKQISNNNIYYSSFY